MMRRAYQTDLSDAEWGFIEPHLPVPKAPGRPRVHPLREILDAIFYVVRGGCAWRLLPHDFPPWKTVYHYFRAWRIDGTWERLHEALRRRSGVRPREEPPAQRRHRRFPEREDHRGGWRRARLRLRQEGEGKKSPPLGGHAGAGAQSEGPCGECLRLRRHKAGRSSVELRPYERSRRTGYGGWSNAQ